MQKYINSGEEKKNELLNEEQEKFLDIKKIFQEKISKKFSLIENSKHLNLKSDYNFLILNKNIFQDIYEDAKNIHIYFFLYDDSPFIFFEKGKKIMSVDWDENDLCFISDIKEDEEENISQNINVNIKNANINEIENEKEKAILENLKKIQNRINENKKKLFSLSFDEDMNNKYSKEYYLINKSWLNEEIKRFSSKRKNSNSKYNLPIKKVFNEKNIINEYPSDFEFIDKDSFEPIIKDLAKKEEINIKDFSLVKIFFVNWQNNIPAKISKYYQNRKYICIKKENNILFYLFTKFCFYFEYFINYTEEKIMKEEIKKYIIKKGIGSYFNDIVGDPSNESFKLINYKLKLFGSCFNHQKHLNKIYSNYIPKALESYNNDNFYNSALLCLVNIVQLKNFFCDREKLINLIEEDSTFSKYLYKIIQDMCLNINEEEEKNDIYINLKNEIINKSESNDILNNIKLLIEFILLSIHNELRTNEKGKKTKTNFFALDDMYQNYNEINKNFYPINKSIIKNLFFFEIEMNYHCNNCNFEENLFFLKCTIDFDITLNQLKNKKIIYLKDLFGLEERSKCYECNKDCFSRRIINTCPKILIIVIKLDNMNTKFYAEPEFDIYNYTSKKHFVSQTKYELISLIENYSITFCKSEQNSWNKYEGSKVISINKFNNKQNTIPYLLIYKQKLYNKYHK